MKNALKGKKGLCIYIYTYTHTHTHTHIYIYIHIGESDSPVNYYYTHVFMQMPKTTLYIIIIKSDKFLSWRNRSRTLKVRILDSQKSSLANRLSYFQNGSLIHVDSRPAPRLSIELQQSNCRYDRPRYTLSRATAIIPLSLHISQ